MGGRAGAGCKAFRSIEAVINPAAGRSGPDALAHMQAIFDEAGITAKITAPEPRALVETVRTVLDRKPDLLVVLAGDGTARAAAQLCGERGPLVAPLPGGTMNMLPKALYGDDDWKTALRKTLAEGVERPVGGGVIGGHTFYVAAMLGASALFAPAREAARERHLVEAWRKARRAYSRAFTGRTRYSLDGGAKGMARSLTLLCPLISRVMDDEEPWLEAAVINPQTPAEALRLGARVILSPYVGDWRDDPAVTTTRCRKGLAWGRGSLPALLDGEPVHLDSRVAFHFNPRAFRAIAPEPGPAETV
jgi:diacylglycerol kinase family enzyme